MASSILERALNFITARRRAYRYVFSQDNQFSRDVLADLARFCRADRSCFHTDSRVHAVLEGRREVWLRITQHLNLSEEELLRLYSTKE